MLPRDKTEAEIHLVSRKKKEARLFFRSFDTEEHVRISVCEAIENVSASLGVILPLISNNRNDSEIHNLRCAFIAGLSHALERETLILQAGDEHGTPEIFGMLSRFIRLCIQLILYVAQFASRITVQKVCS